MFEWLKDKFKKQEKDETKKEEDLVESNEIEDQENADLEKEETQKEPEDQISEHESSDVEAVDEVLVKDESIDKVEIDESETKDQETLQVDLEENAEDNFVKKETEELPLEEKNEKSIEPQGAKVEENLDAKDIDKESVNTEETFESEEVPSETVEERVEKEEAIADKKIAEEKIETLKEDSEDSLEIAESERSAERSTEEEPDNKLGFFGRLKEGLTKTRKEVGIKINTVLGNYVKIDDDMLEDLEDILISADVGMNTTMKLIDNLRETLIREKVNEPARVKPLLMEEAKKLMNPELNSKIISKSPTIILIVGVNGVGKTTTIGKLSQRFKNEGKSVLVCAADTFRAAAIDQLEEWGHRANVDVISHEEGSDPAAVVFDAITAAKARKTDILIVDTAGRLHNKSNLMNELEKINRIIKKNYPEANRETLLVLDATTGQNAMNQAKTFKEASEITGIALTKLDGTAKGGVVIGLQSELEIPIKLVGVGEGIEDLQDFNLDNFIEAIFE